ncbi:MAG: TlpA disulfide reductase family protein [Planctomycetota bacterium]|jgi:peroxiredoxin
MSAARYRSSAAFFALTGGLCFGLGCKTVEQLPSWEEKEPDGAQLAIFEADEPPPDEEAGSEAEDTSAPAPSEGGAAEPATPDPAPAEASEASPPKAEPLPKPLFGKVDQSCGKAPGVGQRVKSFKLKSTSGKTISPASYRGRVMVLNFWGTWCKPCLKELPEFSRLYRRYRKHGMTFVAVATDEDGQAVDEFIKSKKISAKVAIGGEAAAGEYGARTFPFTFVVDGQGIVRAAYDGYKPGCMGKLEADIRKELEKLNK